MTKHQRIECCCMSLLGLDKTADKAKGNLFSDCHLFKNFKGFVYLFHSLFVLVRLERKIEHVHVGCFRAFSAFLCTVHVFSIKICIHCIKGS